MIRSLLFGALLGVAVAGPATSRLRAQQERRWGGPEVGLNLALGLGRGRFQDFVKAAGGFGAYATVPIALQGGLALRADLSVLFHDFETWSGFPPINTKSYITSLRAGPQVALSAGRLQLYGFGAGGFSYFATDAEVESSCDCSFTTTLRDDGARGINDPPLAADQHVGVSLPEDCGVVEEPPLEDSSGGVQEGPSGRLEGGSDANPRKAFPVLKLVGSHELGRNDHRSGCVDVSPFAAVENGKSDWFASSGIAAALSPARQRTQREPQEEKNDGRCGMEGGALSRLRERAHRTHPLTPR